MAALTADPLVQLVLTGVLCLVPTAAFLGLLRLLDRLRNDVLVEHTMRMAAEEGATSLAGTRFSPGAALAAGRPADAERAAAEREAAVAWGDPGAARRLVLCDACATLRSPRPGPCPSCGAVIEEPTDRQPPE
ncbi:hypothetical protein [Halobaculum marinum]|uniref:Uncharacterized protein n=1 Tax=Halobaculum marinum TaxID=3031996 RepID=A0ABD5WWU8_9EURY|nr:hypothetical protein [Halobaculum sp. DT55]